MKKTSRFAEAFKEEGNLLGLAGLVALSAATLNPLPLLVGLVGEAAYMLFVPDSRWYEKRLSAKYDAEVEARRKKLREQILPSLSPNMQGRYNRLEAVRDQIYVQAKENRPWFREVLRKLDFLLEKFLMFGSKEVQFRNYLASVLEHVQRQGGDPELPEFDFGDEDKNRNRRNRDRDKNRRRPPSPLDEDVPDEIDLSPDGNWVKKTVNEIQTAYDEELEKIRVFLEGSGETEAHTKAILEKRSEVIKRRHEHVGRIGSILTNLNHQARLMEDTFGLINDEIRARSPEQVLVDIEEVVFQTNAMTQALEEVAPFEQMVARLTA